MLVYRQPIIFPLRFGSCKHLLQTHMHPTLPCKYSQYIRDKFSMVFKQSRSCFLLELLFLHKNLNALTLCILSFVKVRQWVFMKFGKIDYMQYVDFICISILFQYHINRAYIQYSRAKSVLCIVMTMMLEWDFIIITKCVLVPSLDAIMHD